MYLLIADGFFLLYLKPSGITSFLSYYTETNVNKNRCNTSAIFILGYKTEKAQCETLVFRKSWVFYLIYHLTGI